LFKLKTIKNYLLISLTKEGPNSLSPLAKQEEGAHKIICHHIINIMAEQNKHFSILSATLISFIYHLYFQFILHCV